MAMSLERQNGNESDLILSGRRESLEHLNNIFPTLKKVTRTTRHGIANIWQPSTYLPDFSNPEQAFQHIRNIQEQMRRLPNEVLLVLAGDTLTEEGLPLFVGELASTKGIYQYPRLRGWVWDWAAEENRHGDSMNGGLQFSGRIDMRAFEQSKQLYIGGGFNVQTNGDSYKGFLFYSFQEPATHRSHMNVSNIEAKNDNPFIARMCADIAADENYHAGVYSEFVEEILKVDPNNMMEAIRDMWLQGIVMPAHAMREIDPNGELIDTYAMFSDTAQKIGVYTVKDYSEISAHLLGKWKIGKKMANKWVPLAMNGLDERGKDAQQEILKRQKVIEYVAAKEKPTPLTQWDSSWLVRSDKLAS